MTYVRRVAFNHGGMLSPGSLLSWWQDAFGGILSGWHIVFGGILSLVAHCLWLHNVSGHIVPGHVVSGHVVSGHHVPPPLMSIAKELVFYTLIKCNCQKHLHQCNKYACFLSHISSV